jgi:glucosylceramidase
MNDFVKNHLGPRLRKDNLKVKILGFDQNRDEQLIHWVNEMYGDQDAAGFYDGTAIHWYASTFDYFPEALQFAHSKAPSKHLIQTEACIDAEVPRWQDDEWYWSERCDRLGLGLGN